MNIGKTLFAQLMDFLPWTTFTRIVDRHGGDRYAKLLACTEQFRVMAFAQLTYRESLRDIGLRTQIIVCIDMPHYEIFFSRIINQYVTHSQKSKAEAPSVPTLIILRITFWQQFLEHAEFRIVVLRGFFVRIR